MIKAETAPMNRKCACLYVAD